LHGGLGLAGWQWLFIIEAVPAIILAGMVFFYLTDWPAEAAWLAPDERTWLAVDWNWSSASVRRRVTSRCDNRW
jgi:hypothetical protein